MNPRACGEKAAAVMAKHRLGRKVGVVSGDDLMPRLDELLATGHPLNHLDTGEPITAVRDRLVSANAYLGSRPIADALGRGADIIVTGRVADACLTVGPLLHEFGWADDAWDLLAAGSTAGHLIECGAQATGGLWVNAEERHDLGDVGYPIVDVLASGDFVVKKPKGTGGAVNLETVGEQLLYEVGDPSRYLTPDVTADFTAPELTHCGVHQVHVTGCRGTPATDTYKVSCAYRDGFTASGTLVLVGPDAVAKAERSGEIMRERLRRAGVEPEHWLVELLGAGDVVPGVLPRGNPPEVVLRVAVRDSRKAVVERFGKEFAPLVTSGYAGTGGYTTGRPQVREVFAYWPALIAKSAVSPTVEVVT